jgi:hypothetical protein
LLFIAAFCLESTAASAQQASADVFQQEITTSYGAQVKLPTALQLAVNAKRCVVQTDESRQLLCLQDVLVTARISGMVIGANFVEQTRSRKTRHFVMKAQIGYIEKRMAGFEREF